MAYWKVGEGLSRVSIQVWGPKGTPSPPQELKGGAWSTPNFYYSIYKNNIGSSLNSEKYYKIFTGIPDLPYTAAIRNIKN